MANHTLSQQDFLDHLSTQKEFLRSSAAAFDRGNHRESVRMAQAARVLVNDTKNQTSVLKSLDMKNGKFLDTAHPYNDKNLSGHSGLVSFGFFPNGTRPIPDLDGGAIKRWIDFEDWWNGTVFADKQKNEFSRRDIVLTLTDKEGGAHVDPVIDEAYHNLRRNNSLGWETVGPDGRGVPMADVVPVAMRQIAHELLRSLGDPEVSASPPADVGMIMSGFSFTEGAAVVHFNTNLRKDRPKKEDGSKLGRNDRCPCGSGKKAKHCCWT
ncbi:SEC-C metal-binding domain-containing protein [Asticcacaulis sp.]|uniref:SEC-C metal-binding domain-containing protein n=1 Tax=Asticcacaulis sp. TaxID=1872648 RepID=UPI003F7C7408